jgi:hypothetical protein
MRNWTVEHALPRCQLVIDRLFFARKFRESWPESVAELERDANRHR